MKYLHHFLLALVATGCALLVLPLAANALVSYPPGSMLQPGDVSTTTIRDYAVTPSKVASAYAFNFSSSTINSLNVIGSSTAPALLVAGTTSFNGVSYVMPSTQGAAASKLQNDGAGNLSWVTTANQLLSTQMIAESVIGVTSTPIAVKMTPNLVHAIAYGNSTGGGTFMTTNPIYSNTVTVGTGANECLFIGARGYQTDNGKLGLSVDGIWLPIATSTGPGGAGNIQLVMGYKCGLSAGSHTWTASSTSTGSADIFAVAQDVTGVAQATPVDVIASNAASTVNITTLTNDSWVMAMQGQVSGSYTGGNMGIIQSETSPVGGALGESSSYISPAQATTQTITTSGTGNQYIIAWSVVPAVQPFYGLVTADAAATTTSDAFMGFITATSSIGSYSTVIIAGVLSGFSNLTPGTAYYLTNAGGYIASTTGTVAHKIGAAINATTLRLWGQ